MDLDNYTPKIGVKRLEKVEARRARKRRFRFISIGLVVFMSLVAVVKVTLTSESPDRVSRPPASSVPGADTASPRPAVFAEVSDRGLALRLPAPKSEIIAIGYHQAYNPKALALDSRMRLKANATSTSISRIASPGRPVAFLMASRGRGSAPTSSVDVAVKEGAVIKSPVSGRIEAVEPYLLYGRYDDFKIDIIPAGQGSIKISIVHLDRPVVFVGQQVEAGVTPLAVPRQLAVNSQIDQYLGRVAKHIHLQINPFEPGKVAANGN